MRALLAAPLLLLALLPVPAASAELECGDAWNPCEIGPCAEFYQYGSAFVVDPGDPSCYRDHGSDTAEEWLAWLREAVDWVECQATFLGWCGPVPPPPHVPSERSGQADGAGPLDWLFDFLDWVECVNDGGGIECDSPPPPRIK